MGELSIKIKIGDREYPMRVDAAEEERIRKAGKIINERLKAYKDQFRIDDKQDLLAMVAFDCAVERMRVEDSHFSNDQSVVEKISHLNKLISQAF